LWQQGQQGWWWWASWSLVGNVGNRWLDAVGNFAGRLLRYPLEMIGHFGDGGRCGRRILNQRGGFDGGGGEL